MYSITLNISSNVVQRKRIRLGSSTSKLKFQFVPYKFSALQKLKFSKPQILHVYKGKGENNTSEGYQEDKMRHVNHKALCTCR